MKLKQLLIISVLLLIFISVAGVSAADENSTSDFISDNTHLSDTHVSQTFDDLRNEVNNASAGSVINITNDFYLINDTDSVDIKNDNITIDGRNFTFYGNSSEISPVFRITGKNVVLTNIQFRNFELENAKYIIEWFGKNGAMSNCRFIGNTAFNGGTVEWSGSEGLIDSCSFENNFAQDGGTLHLYAHMMTVTSSNFINNRASDNGGAIYIIGRDCLLEKCHFENCSSSEDGGAIYIEANNQIINGCEFINCSGFLGYGGAIYMIGDSNLINGSSFFNCTTGYGGGAIYLSGVECCINNSYFNNNRGVVIGGGILAFDNRNLIIDKCEIIRNAAANGGALYMNEIGRVNNSKFQENIAIDGGAINAKKVIQIENSSFNGNNAINSAGALLLEDDSEIIDCIFTENSVSTTGGAILTSDDLIINNTIFANNFAGDGSNNIALVSNSNITADNKTSYDSPLFMKVAKLSISKVTNLTYGDSLNIVVDVAFNSEPVQNGTVIAVIGNNSYFSDVYNGCATFNITKLNVGEYTVSFTYKSEGYAETSAKSDFTVFKNNAVLTAKTSSFIINYAKNYQVKVTDAQGRAVSDKTVTFKLSGKTIGSVKTNENGIAKLKITSKILKKAKAGKRKLTVVFEDSNFNGTYQKTVNVKINKEKTKINAKKKTFKLSKKTKKYTIKLKNSKGKGIKNVKVILKVNKKKYVAKTNKKGKATFKITKLNKKGKFKTVIKFKANKYYKAKTKKVKLTVKR